MNEVIQCGKGFDWNPHEHSFSQAVKSEYVVDDELFGVDKAPPMYSKSAKTVPTASTNDVAASLQTAFCRKPSHKGSDLMYNPHRDDTIKSEMNENVYGYNQNQFNNGQVQQQVPPQHPDMNMPMNCNMNNAQSDAQQMDIYRDLILRHLIQDISTTCAKLGLPTDPYNWTSEHGSRWITEMCQQFSLALPPQSYLTGRVLLGMTQKDFEALSPEGGDTLYAQLQLWKTAFESYQPQHCPAGQGGAMTAADNSMPRNGWMENPCDKQPSRPEFSQPPQQFNPEMQNMQPFYNNGNFTPSATTEHSSFFSNDVMLSPSNSDMSSNSSMHDGNEDDCLDLQLNMLQMQRPPGMGFGGQQMMNGSMGMASPARDDRPSPFPRHSGTVHLWHFIRELLDHPKQYGSCVRWVDREEGTFKIESSHHLARFWGQRKNRSQMNYDKLSRSLRQYYKKGIIQKPEKKQRLVYKFLPPYNL